MKPRRRRILLAGSLCALAFTALADSTLVHSQPRGGQQGAQAAGANTAAATAAAAAATQEPTPTVVALSPADAARGESVTVTGTFPDPVQIAVDLKRMPWSVQSAGTGGADGKPPEQFHIDSVSVKEPKTSFTFVVPHGIPLGRYEVLVSFTQKGKTFGPVLVPVEPDGIFDVISRDEVRVSSVFPIVSYPKKDTFEFKVLGEGFSPVLEDNALVIEGRGVVAACPKDEKTADDCVYEQVSDNGRELKFWNIPLDKYKGQLNVRVRVGDKLSDKAVGVTLARVGKRYPAVVASVFVLLLAAIILWLLRNRRKALTSGASMDILSAVFLDPETNTYSLSKFQFYFWTGAALFGYIYLTVSKSWVQGDFTFADIPGNLPGIIFISASTSVLATGITSSKGSKGAGEIHPTLADFVSSGGVIAAERLQFFVWTIIGVAAFIFLTLSVEPGSIHELPSIPENFLYLMGISSFGYIGGKLARKPGPVITKMEADVGSLTLTIHGANLSPDARFRIDDADIPANFLNDDAHPDRRPKVLSSDDQPGFAKVLQLVLDTDDPSAKGWETGQHSFTIINPDGQKAAWNFTPTPAPPPEDESQSPQGQNGGGTQTGQGGTQTQTGQTGGPTQQGQGGAETQTGQPGGGGGTTTTQQDTTVTQGPEGGGTTPANTPDTTPANTPATMPAAMTVTNVTPSSGPVGGGTPVIILGTNFAASSAVTFGGIPAVTVTYLGPSTLVAQSPPHAEGAVDIVVQTPGGGSVTSTGGYKYVAEVQGTA